MQAIVGGSKMQRLRGACVSEEWLLWDAGEGFLISRKELDVFVGLWADL